MAGLCKHAVQSPGISGPCLTCPAARVLAPHRAPGRAPESLYENGLQRDLFLPFIDRLGRETRVHNMSSTIDYRRLAHHSQVQAAPWAGLSRSHQDPKYRDVSDVYALFSHSVWLPVFRRFTARCCPSRRGACLRACPELAAHAPAPFQTPVHPKSRTRNRRAAKPALQGHAERRDQGVCGIWAIQESCPSVQKMLRSSI